MLTVNHALTAHLQSVAEVNETREDLLAALKGDPKALLPIDRISGVLEKIITYQGKVEEVKGFIDEARTILKGN